MSFGERKRVPDSWTEKEVHWNFPAAAFRWEKKVPNPHETTTTTTTTTTIRTIDQQLREVRGIFSHLPCRTLEHWYLVAKPDRDETFSFPFRRVPLPLDTQDLGNYVLVGTLQPQQSGQKGVKVELDNLDFYTIDHSKEYRGYWVFTSKASYWLRSPCSKEITIPKLKLRLDGDEYRSTEDEVAENESLIVQLPSQERLHRFHRAQLGLISNVRDILILPDGSYNSFVRDLSATQLYDVLTPTTMGVDDYHRTIKTASKFLLPHIRAIDAQIATSRWYSELMRRNCIEELVGPLQSVTSEYHWINSSINVEAPSPHLPCGEIDPEELDTCVDDLQNPIELPVELQYHNSKSGETSFWENDHLVDDDLPTQKPLQSLPRIEEMDLSALQMPSARINAIVSDLPRIDGIQNLSSSDVLSAPRVNVAAEQNPKDGSRMGEIDMSTPDKPFVGIKVVSEQSPKAILPPKQGMAAVSSIHPSIGGNQLDAAEMVACNPVVTRTVELLPTIPKKRHLPQEHARIVDLINPLMAPIPRKKLNTVCETVQSLIFYQPECPKDSARAKSTVKDIPRGQPYKPTRGLAEPKHINRDRQIPWKRPRFNDHASPKNDAKSRHPKSPWT